MSSEPVSQEFDLYDISERVRPVLVETSLLPTSVTGFTNGENYYFDHSQVQLMASALKEWQLIRRVSGGWSEVIPGRSMRALAERHIRGRVYFRFRTHWGFEPSTVV